MSQPIDEFRERARYMCQNFAVDLEEHMLELFEKMTPDERAKFDFTTKPYHLVRAIALTVGPDALSQRFAVEAIHAIVPRVRRIYNQNRD